MIDIHCHILPGLDDGARTIDDSLKMARFAEQDGVETIVATPHVFRPPFHQNDFSQAERKWKYLISLIEENNIQVRLLLGAEVHFVHDLSSVLKTKLPWLAINRGSYMIVEFPPNHVFSGVKELFFELASRGLNLIIAHPERNSVFSQNPSLLFDLITIGAFTQANSGSFTSLYGSKVRETAFRFLEWNFYHFLASDSHGSHSKSLRISTAFRLIQESVGKEEALAFTNHNPKAAIEDRDLPYYKEPVDPASKKKTLYIRVPRFLRKK